MKKYSILFIFLLCSIASFAQKPLQSQTIIAPRDSIYAVVLEGGYTKRLRLDSIKAYAQRGLITIYYTNGTPSNGIDASVKFAVDTTSNPPKLWTRKNGAFVEFTSGGADTTDFTRESYLPSESITRVYRTVNGIKTYIGFYDEINKRFGKDIARVVCDGQSNSIGQQTQAGPFVSDSLTAVWDTITSVWKPAVRGAHPFNPNGANNMALAFCDKLAKDGYIVRLVQGGNSGQPIAYWIGAGTVGYTVLDTKIINSGIPQIDHFIWCQGESDGSTTDATYLTNWYNLFNSWAGRPYWKNAKTYVMGIHPSGASPQKLPNIKMLPSYLKNSVFVSTANVSLYDNYHYRNTGMDSLATSIYTASLQPNNFKYDGGGIVIQDNNISIGRAATDPVGYGALKSARVIDGGNTGIEFRDGAFNLYNTTVSQYTDLHYIDGRRQTRVLSTQRGTDADRNLDSTGAVLRLLKSDGSQQFKKNIIVGQNYAMISGEQGSGAIATGTITKGYITFGTITTYNVGKMVVRIVSGNYSASVNGQSGNGAMIRKEFNISTNATSGSYTTSRVLQVDDQIANRFAIGELEYSSGAWRIPILHNNVTPAATFQITVEFISAYNPSPTTVFDPFIENCVIPKAADFTTTGDSFVANVSTIPVITGKISNTSITIPTITAGATGTATVTVTGAAVGDIVRINPRADLASGLSIAYAYVSAANTVKIGWMAGTAFTTAAVNFDIITTK